MERLHESREDGEARSTPRTEPCKGPGAGQPGGVGASRGPERQPAPRRCLGRQLSVVQRGQDALGKLLGRSPRPAPVAARGWHGLPAGVPARGRAVLRAANPHGCVGFPAGPPSSRAGGRRCPAFREQGSGRAPHFFHPLLPDAPPRAQPQVSGGGQHEGSPRWGWRPGAGRRWHSWGT